MNMSITIHTENADDVARVLAALAGTGVPVVTAAALPKAPKAEKQKENPTQPSSAAAEKDMAASSTASAGTVAPSNTQSTSAEVATSPQIAVTGLASDYVPDEAALTAAANSAIAKLGAGAQAKIKAYIAENFRKDDGSPAGLRTVLPEHRAILLADLNAFAAGTKVI